MTLRLHYKGLSAEDRVFSLTPDASAAKARGTLYEAWFDTLKTSPWYNELTVTGNFPSPSAAQTWAYFGDLRTIEFRDWWLARGYEIFAETVPYEPIQVQSVTTKLKPSTNQSRPPRLVIEVPLNLSPAALRDQFETILRQQAQYAADFDRWQHSTAPVHQHRETKLDYKTIRRWLDIFRSYEKAVTQRGFTLYDFAAQMGLHPLLSRKEFRGRKVPEDLRVKMANVASDTLKSVRALMANATELRFPDTTPHAWAKSGTRATRAP